VYPWYLAGVLGWDSWGFFKKPINLGQITIILKPELRSFWGDSLANQNFRVRSCEVAIISPKKYSLLGGSSQLVRG